jgi:hypothetical protein
MRKLKQLPDIINGVEVIKDLGMNEQIPAKRIAQFRCSCGKLFIGKINAVKVGHKTSCGCKRNGRPTHGLSKHPLYRKWSGMITRTTNKKERSYRNYGHRGIVVCDEWRNDFLTFYNWAINNGWKKGLTIDRIDVNGNYEPNNCQWLTMKENTMKDRYSEFIKNNKVEEICDRYLNEHITITELANQLGTYKEVVSNILKDNNIKIKHRRMKK